MIEMHSEQAQADPALEGAAVSAVLPGRLRPGFEPLYGELIELYAPLIGSDGLALYVYYLSHRHSGRKSKTPELAGYAWPGDRRACAALGWSRGSPRKGAPNRIQRTRAVLEAVGLVELTSVGQLLDTGVVTLQQARTLAAPTIPLSSLRRKLVALVNDPLERDEFRAAQQEIEARVHLLTAKAAAAKPTEEVVPLGASDAPREEAPPLAHPMRQVTAHLMRQSTAHPMRQIQTEGIQTEGNQTEQQPPGVVVAKGPPQTDETRTALAAYGILEPTLSQCAGNDLGTVWGWIIYLDDQEKLSREQRRGILIARLREGALPPEEYLVLGGISREEARWLAANRSYREAHHRWPEDEESPPIPLAVAETWLRYKLAGEGQLYFPPAAEAEECPEEASDTVGEDNGDGGSDGLAAEPERLPEARKRGNVLYTLQNALHLLGSFEERRKAPLVLDRIGETGLSWDELARCVQQAQRKAMDKPPGERLSCFYHTLDTALAALVDSSHRAPAADSGGRP